MVDFDYVIVGAGAAGCVLADRLSADPDNQVLLLEYGGRDSNPMLFVPKGFYFTLREKPYTYHYPTQPVGPDRKVEDWTRGKGLGGSTVVNGMMWIRGAPADWDGLAARGNPGWNWQRVLPAYRAMEDHNLGASDMRGAGGPLGVSVVEDDDELVQAVLASAQDMGWEHVADCVSAVSPGCALPTPPSFLSNSPATPRPRRWRSPGLPPTSSSMIHESFSQSPRWIFSGRRPGRL